MSRNPLLGLIGFSDGDLDVHKQLKDIAQVQVDIIAADNLVASASSAKKEAEKFKAKGVNGTIFSCGFFAFSIFSALAAKNGQGPFLLIVLSF
jgi:L-fucose isomerase